MGLRLAVCFVLVLLAGPAFALYDADDPQDMGTILADNELTPPESAPGSSCGARWKSTRVQAVASGTATHFILWIMDTGGHSAGKIGCSVHEGTSNYYERPGALKLAAYHPSFDISNGPGFYAIPFTSSPGGTEIVAGRWYHLSYYVEQNCSASFIGTARDNSGPPAPAKWASTCKYPTCSAAHPPNDGTEPDWHFQYDPPSAPYDVGILAVEGPGPDEPPAAPTGIGITEVITGDQ